MLAKLPIVKEILPSVFLIDKTVGTVGPYKQIAFIDSLIVHTDKLEEI